MGIADPPQDVGHTHTRTAYYPTNFALVYLDLDLWKHDVEAEACLSRGPSREEAGRRVNLIFATPVASTSHMNPRLVTDYCASLKAYVSMAANELCG